MIRRFLKYMWRWTEGWGAQRINMGIMLILLSILMLFPSSTSDYFNTVFLQLIIYVLTFLGGVSWFEGTSEGLRLSFVTFFLGSEVIWAISPMINLVLSWVLPALLLVGWVVGGFVEARKERKYIDEFGFQHVKQKLL